MTASAPPPTSVALFGTSADPPTCGHQALLKELLQRFPLVATWASDNPLKQHGASLEQRAELLGALVGALQQPRLLLTQELSSPWALTTLERAAARWPGAELVFVVGSDLLEQLPRWRQAPAVLAACRLAVVPRQGWPLQEPVLQRLRQLGARLELLPLQIPASASSEVRRAPQRQQVPAAVWPVLLEHNLYGLGSPA
jgi:nicotinate-nucleotide adenylyltransferase